MKTTAFNNPGAPIALRRWCALIGISDTTAWRWRKLGLISPINIAGKLYLTAEEQARFNERAARGEFAKTPAGVAARKGGPQ